MPAAPQSLKELFLDALSVAPAERAAWLERACADPEIRRQARMMLAAHDSSHSLLDRPAPVPAPAGVATEYFAPTEESPGTVIGPYKLLEQIGEGGFGVVFMAEQTEPVRRKVALKILKPGMETRQVVARFEAERQALALMDHPNIARVLDADATDAGHPYFVMELVRGIPITQFCDEKRLVARWRLELFISVCRAVQHAHQKGIIHRDIKPSNVLVTLHDGTPVAKVIDFGIAKALGQQLTDKTLFTGFAQLIGTPLYMSPEQAELSGLDVDTRTDIYALGVLLYELLTGTTPLDKERLKNAGYDELRRIIRDEEPPRPSTRVSTLGQAAATVSTNRQCDPRKLTQLIRGELDWIVMKCLEKDRNRRYETVGALVADVQRYLNDQPIEACPPSAWYRFCKLARRNRRALVTVSVLVLAALIGVGTLAASTFLVWRANKDLKESAEREHRAAEGERHEVYCQRITVAYRELSIGNVAAALRALDDCPIGLRGWEWYYLMRLWRVEPVVLQDSTEVYGVAFSPNGEQIASVGKEGKVKIWNSRTRRIIKEFPAHQNAAACSVVFHPHGRYLATTGDDRLVKVWDLETGQKVFEDRCDPIRRFGAAYTVAFRPPDGRHLAAGYEEKVRIWDWQNNQIVHTFAGPAYHSIPVAFSQDGHRLATGGPWGQGLNLWDAETGRPLGSLPTHRHPASALAFSPNGERLAEASLGRRVSLWETATGEVLHLPHSGNVHGVAFSPDSSRVASVGQDKTVHLWDATTGREMLGLRGHTDNCSCVAFSPDGRRLASASNDGTIIIWDATPFGDKEKQELFTFTEHDEEIRCLAVSPPDGRMIVSAGNGPPAKVWDAATGRVNVEFHHHTVLVFSLAWHRDGRRIATAGSDGRHHAVKVWDESDAQVQYEISVGGDSSSGPFQAVAFSPDGRYLVTGKLEGAVQVWDARTGQKVQALNTMTGQKFDTFAMHDREIRGLVFSRDGRQLASASGDGWVKVWDATRLDEKQEPRRVLKARVPGPSLNVAFNADGRRFVMGGERNTILIWDLENDREALPHLQGHVGEVHTIAISPDNEGRWIASGGEDSTVKIWDSRTGKLVHTFRGHKGYVSSLAFSPDGTRLYSGSRDKTVKVWDVSKLGQEPVR